MTASLTSPHLQREPQWSNVIAANVENVGQSVTGSGDVTRLHTPPTMGFAAVAVVSSEGRMRGAGEENRPRRLPKVACSLSLPEGGGGLGGRGMKHLSLTADSGGPR